MQTMPQGTSEAPLFHQRHRSNLTEASLSHHNAISSVDCADPFPDDGFERQDVATAVPYSHPHHQSFETVSSKQHPELVRDPRQMVNLMVNAQRRYDFIASCLIKAVSFQSTLSCRWRMISSSTAGRATLACCRPRSPSPQTSQPGQTCISAPEIEQLDEDIVSVQAILETQSQAQDTSPQQNVSIPAHSRRQPLDPTQSQSTFPAHANREVPGRPAHEPTLQPAPRNHQPCHPLPSHPAAQHETYAHAHASAQQRAPSPPAQPGASQGPSQALVLGQQSHDTWPTSPRPSRSHSPRQADAARPAGPRSPTSHVHFSQHTRDDRSRPRSLSPGHDLHLSSSSAAARWHGSASPSGHMHRPHTHSACCPHSPSHPDCNAVVHRDEVDPRWQGQGGAREHAWDDGSDSGDEEMTQPQRESRARPRRSGSRRGGPVCPPCFAVCDSAVLHALRFEARG